MTKEITLQRLKRIGIIYNEEVKLKHAGLSKFYVDVKLSSGYTEILKMLADDLWEIMDKNMTCVVSQGYGGLPLSTAIAVMHNVPHQTFVRDKPKDHGPKKGSLLEGYEPNENDLLAIVDDVGTTGESLLENINVVRSSGAEIVGAYTVVKRGDFELGKVPYKWLFVPEDFL